MAVPLVSPALMVTVAVAVAETGSLVPFMTLNLKVMSFGRATFSVLVMNRLVVFSVYSLVKVTVSLVATPEIFTVCALGMATV